MISEENRIATIARFERIVLGYVSGISTRFVAVRSLFSARWGLRRPVIGRYTGRNKCRMLQCEIFVFTSFFFFLFLFFVKICNYMENNIYSWEKIRACFFQEVF